MRPYSANGRSVTPSFAVPGAAAARARRHAVPAAHRPTACRRSRPAAGASCRSSPRRSRCSTAEAMCDIAHLPAARRTSSSCAAILDDPEASANDRFVALDLLKNACIAAGGVLPMCQDTGTAIVMGKKGEHVLTGGGDESRDRPRHLRDLRRRQPALLADGAAHRCGTRRTPARTCRPQIELVRRPTATRTSSCSWPRAAARRTRATCSRRRRRCSTPTSLMRFLDEKLRTLGTAACPPYHLARRDRRHVGRVRA